MNDQVILTVMDLQGKMLLEKDLLCSAGEIQTIGLHSFREGAYLVRLHFSEHTKSESKFFLIENHD